MWGTADEDYQFLINYEVEGEFVIPSSALATVRDSDGVAITGLLDVVLDVTSTSTTLTIPASDNAVEVGKSHDVRFVVVTFFYGGAQYQVQKFYRLTPFIPMTVTPEDARREIGLDRSELPDADIDLLGAYFKLAADRGATFTDAMTDGTEKALAANQAIAVMALLALVNSLQFRAAIKLKSENSAFERMNEFDIGLIRTRLGQRLTSLLDVVEETVDTGRPSFVVTAPTDVITGE